MGSIWYHEGIARLDGWQYAGDMCIFCSTALRRDADAEAQKNTSLVRAHAEGTRSAIIGICPACGWWKLTLITIMRSRFAPRENGLLDEDWGIDTWGAELRQLTVPNIEDGLAEVRMYLTARFGARHHVHPKVFEDVVASVFHDHGYDASVTAYSGDGGIDVVLNAPNGDLIGVQVKRYRGSIEAEQIRAFAGALVLGGYTRGIFVTTSRFRSGAISAANVSMQRGYPIELIDAEGFYGQLKLAQIASYDDTPLVKPWHTLT